MANNLPQCKTQSSITHTLNKIFGDDNIVGIHYGHNNNQTEERQTGWCHIQCLNATIYMEWLYKSTYILGCRVGFIPHKGNIDGKEPNKTAIRLAQTPTCEAIAQKIQAMSNAVTAAPLVMEKSLTNSFMDLVIAVDKKLTRFANNTNSTQTRELKLPRIPSRHTLWVSEVY